MNDNRITASSEAKIPADREHVDGPQGLSRSEVACSSHTLQHTRQMESIGCKDDQLERLNGTTGIDWWQLAACVKWDNVVAPAAFQLFNEAKLRAQQTFAPIPLEIGDDLFCVDRKGHGKGRDSHKEIQLLWNGGVVVGLSQRINASRQMSNASLLVSGEPCLIYGWGTCWEFFHRIINSIGGKIEDEWIKRVDLCIDLPELELNESLGAAARNQQFVASCTKSALYQEPDGLKGFSIGKSNRARVVIYDKLDDVMTNHNSVYRQAMVQKRWAGVVPSCATRVEFQIGREWLKQYGLRKSADISRIGDIYDKLTSDSRGVFRMTAEPVDRLNRHQNRSTTHPVWQRIVDIGRETVEEGQNKLVRIDRSGLDELRAVKQIVGFGTSLADRRQRLCATRGDLHDAIDIAFDENGIDDEYILSKFERKAKLSGTWQELFQFPPKEAA